MPLLGATGGGSAKGFGALANLGYFIRNSLRFRRSVTAYLSRTPASAGNRQIMTYSFWVKRGFVGSLTSDDYCPFSASTDASNGAVIYFNSSNSQSLDVFLRVGATNYSVTTSQRFADPAAWYHIVVAIDTTQATSSNRTKVYVNGSQVTAFSAASYVPQNSNLAFNNNVAQYIGTQYASSSYFDGYMGEIYFIDGQQLTPSSFGKTDAATGQWIPKKYAGTYGTNGFYLKFADASAATAAAIGKDSSGNGNNWTPNNISVTSGVTYDAMTDSPTLSAAASNYATFNPLDNGGNTVSNGNLTITANGATHYTTKATIQFPKTGKWYWEANLPNVSASRLGIGMGLSTQASSGFIWNTTGTYGLYDFGSGNVYVEINGVQQFSFLTDTNPTVMFAYDADNETIYIGQFGTWYNSTGGTNGNPSTLSNPTGTGISATADFVPMGSAFTSGSVNVNFGQRPFAYTIPSGFKALNTFNLP